MTVIDIRRGADRFDAEHQVVDALELGATAGRILVAAGIEAPQLGSEAILEAASKGLLPEDIHIEQIRRAIGVSLQIEESLLDDNYRAV